MAPHVPNHAEGGTALRCRCGSGAFDLHTACGGPHASSTAPPLLAPAIKRTAWVRARAPACILLRRAITWCHACQTQRLLFWISRAGDGLAPAGTSRTAPAPVSAAPTSAACLAFACWRGISFPLDSGACIRASTGGKTGLFAPLYFRSPAGRVPPSSACLVPTPACSTSLLHRL